MTPDELRAGIYWLTERLYSEECLVKRRRPFFDNLWRKHDQLSFDEADEPVAVG